MGKRINFTRDQENEIINFYLKPETVLETAKVFGFSENVIYRILRKNNISKHSKEVLDSIILRKREQTNLCKYGVKCALQDVSVKEKIKNTCLKRYGTENVSKSEIIKDKVRKTCLKKYGVNNYSSLQECKNKVIETNLEKYGTQYYSQTQDFKDSIKETCLKKYGVDFFTQSNKFKEKAKNTVRQKYNVEFYNQTELSKEQHKITCLKKYGVCNYSQTEEFKNKFKFHMLKCYKVDHYSKTEDFKTKVYNTKKLNHTFNISKPEEDYYKYLLTKFKKEDIVRQYKDSRYPFSCDFYIKSLDLFIELNLHWSHGDHPFDRNNKEDVNKLKLWAERAKTSKYYQNAIKVWTELDLNKQKVAKENNLNYLAIYQ